MREGSRGREESCMWDLLSFSWCAWVALKFWGEWGGATPWTFRIHSDMFFSQQNFKKRRLQRKFPHSRCLSTILCVWTTFLSTQRWQQGLQNHLLHIKLSNRKGRKRPKNISFCDWLLSIRKKILPRNYQLTSSYVSLGHLTQNWVTWLPLASQVK